MAVVGAAWTAISGALATFKASALGSFLTTNIFGRLLTSVAFSALQAALVGTPDTTEAGIRTQQTLTGGVTPASFIVGKYATEGQLLAPPMSHGQDGKTPNAYLTYVVELGDIPGQEFAGLILDGERAEFGTEDHPDYGTPILGRFTDYAWVKYYDGTQTVADPMLLDKYGTYPDRPWQADMIGQGICYAIFTFRFNREIFSGFPKVRSELIGIPLYDPRKDSSVGGSGAHRWGDKSTWEPSENIGVQVYNVLRGIDLGGGNVWGGSADAEDLPLSTWWAVMNQADLGVLRSDSSTEPQWRSSFEVFVDDEPAKLIEDWMRGCSGKMLENGGIWKARLGGPGLPLYYFTDDDVILSEPETNTPFSEGKEPYNAVQAVYPDPLALWEPKDAPGLFSAAFEAEDGGQRRTANLNLPATPYAKQVQQVMRTYHQDERRLRQHVLSLPPEAIPLEPLDVVAWTSEKNGYITKHWDIDGSVDPLTSGVPQFRIREVDPTDYDWSPTFELPVSYANTNRTPLPVQPVAGFGFQAIVAADASGKDRRAGLQFLYDGVDQDDVRGFMWEVRLQGTTDVLLRGSIVDITPGFLRVFEGVLGATAYEGRGQWIADRPTEWTAWASAVTDDLGITEDDVGQDIWDRLAADDQLFFDRFQTIFDRTIAELAGFSIDNVSKAILEQARVDGEIKRVEDTFGLEIDDANAEITTIKETAISDAAALAQFTTTVNASFGDVQADITAIQTAAASDEQALAALETSLTASIGDIAADVVTVSAALASLESSTASFETSITSQFNTLNGYVSTQIYTKSQTDFQISAQVNTVQSNVDNLSTTVTQVSTAQQGLLGQWGVRVNSNGAVSGFGLLSGAGGSAFYVDASEFRVGEGSNLGNYVAALQVIGGVVYIRKGMLQEADVGTLNIQGEAVIVPEASTRNDTIVGNGAWQTVHTDIVNLDQPGSVLLIWSGLHSYQPGSGSGYAHDVRFVVNGNVHQSRGGTAIQDYPVLAEVLLNQSGIVVVSVQWKAGNLLQLRNRTMSIFGAKR